MKRDTALKIKQRQEFDFVFKFFLLLTLLFFSVFFYYFQAFKSVRARSPGKLHLQVIITEIPETIQNENNPTKRNYIFPELRKSKKDTSFTKEEAEKMAADSTFLLSFREFSRSVGTSNFSDSLLGERVQENPPFISREQYKEMLKNMKPGKIGDSSPSETPSNVQDELNRIMGRESQLLMSPKINVLDLFSKSKIKKGKRDVDLEGILACEKFLTIMDTLWVTSPLTASEIYRKKSVRKVNTMGTLTKALDVLIEYGFAEAKQNTYGEYEYKTRLTLKQLLNLVNDYVAISTQKKGKTYYRLISIQSSLVLNHEIY